jgi:integrase
MGKDVDLDGKHITITGSTAVVSGQRIDGTAKSGRSRVVTIDSETVAVLRDHRQQQAAERDRLGDAWLGTSDGNVSRPAGADLCTPTR